MQIPKCTGNVQQKLVALEHLRILRVRRHILGQLRTLHSLEDQHDLAPHWLDAGTVENNNIRMSHMSKHPDLVRHGHQVLGPAVVRTAPRGLHCDGGPVQPGGDDHSEPASPKELPLRDVDVLEAQEPPLALAQPSQLLQAAPETVGLLLRHAVRQALYVQVVEDAVRRGGIGHGRQVGGGVLRQLLRLQLPLRELLDVLMVHGDLWELVAALGAHPQADEEGGRLVLSALGVHVAATDNEHVHLDVSAHRTPQRRWQQDWSRPRLADAALQALLLTRGQDAVHPLTLDIPPENEIQALVRADNGVAVVREPNRGVAQHRDDGLHQRLLGRQRNLGIENAAQAPRIHPGHAEPADRVEQGGEVYPQLGWMTPVSDDKLPNDNVQA
mmetsp:Transcript_69371/g.206613  ORF Transcript_69371/g.206613 Transcript_69371/m.206613 type:complete len:385 (+) Transcript_69371:1552-2706(+)